jgi:hypothetical protein
MALSRYIKVNGMQVTQHDEISKSDLLLVRSGHVDAIIDTKYDAYYDSNTNEWKPVPKV